MTRAQIMTALVSGVTPIVNELVKLKHELACQILS